jgi:hypothetical protein
MRGPCSLSRGVVLGLVLAWVLPSAAAPFTVVDWGGNYVANPPAIYQPFQTSPTSENQLFDYGGNPDTKDSRRYIPFSDTVLLSPSANYSGTSARFYGGWNSIVYDVALTGSKPQTQIGVLDSTTTDTIRFRGGSGLGEAAGSVVWLKADYLSGTDKTLVLSSGCTLRIYVADTGVASGGTGVHRIVVRDGSQYYVSNSSSSSVGWLTISNPATETWATFNPANSNNRLNDIGATYATRTFSDVQAIGYYWSGTIGGAYTASPQVQDAEFMAAFPAPKGTVISVF